MKFRSLPFTLLLLLQLQACSHSINHNLSRDTARASALPELDSSHFANELEALSEPQIFALTDKQKQAFLDYYYAPVRADIRADRRLYNYMESRLSDFDFQGKTYVATEALAKGQGNCMSLAIVTTAFARLVNLEVEYQKVNSLPVYRQQDNLLMISSHVRTKVLDPAFQPEENQLVITRPGTVIDYFPSGTDFLGGKVSQADFLAKFYQNLGADALLKKDYTSAFAQLKVALEYSPANVETLNMLAVLYSRIGQDREAEKWYQYAVDNNLKSVNLYSNYRNFLLRHNKTQQAQQLEQQLDLSDDRNPYSWLKLGHEAFNQGYTKAAARHYMKVITLAPYLGEGYFGLAKTHYKAGEIYKATQAMNKAIELAYTPESRQLYYAKLATLRGSM